MRPGNEVAGQELVESRGKARFHNQASKRKPAFEYFQTRVAMNRGNRGQATPADEIMLRQGDRLERQLVIGLRDDDCACFV